MFDSFKQRLRNGYYVFYLVLCLIGLVCVIPILWSVSASLHSNHNLFTIPFRWFPKHLLFGNYPVAWNRAGFGGAMERSFAIALVISMLSVVFGLMAGYALATLPFKGRRLYFILVIGVLLVPFPSIMVAVFIMTQKLGLVDTYLGVIVPGALSPLGVFLMRQYLLRLPKEMVEAARIDGANEFRIFVQLIVPLSWPVISAVAVLTFVASWNNLLWPLIVLSQPAHYTMPLALTEFNSVNATDYVGIVAMSVVAIAPIVILFLLSRRRLLDSIMLSGGGVVG